MAKKFFNDYYQVISPTGASVGVVKYNDSDIPWTKISGNNGIWRYYTDKFGEFHVQKDHGESSWYDMQDESDIAYWKNYADKIEKKIKDKPSQNWWQYTFNQMEPIKQKGGTIDKVTQSNLKLAGKKVPVTSKQGGGLGTFTLPKNLTEDQAAGRTPVYTGKDFEYFLNGDGVVVKHMKTIKNYNGGKLSYMDIF